ncbi:MAG TPA: hypothetical protein VKV79_07845 [Terriglobia bacterium]|nr:hypothetical protein [Terriglobia bacterium]
MAFIRKRGNAYYLVHNVRKDGQVRQLHLACLGRRPRIDQEIIAGVAARHPFVRINWDDVRERASREWMRPVQEDSEYLRNLLAQTRDLHMNLADLQRPMLEMTQDRDLQTQLLAELKLLRGTLDVKLNPSRKSGLLNLRGKI